MPLNSYKQFEEIKLFTLGINGLTGKLLTEPIELKDFYPQIEKMALKKRKNFIKDYFKESYKNIYSENFFWTETPLNDLKKAGWGIIINKNEKDLIEILNPLIKKRDGKIYFYNNEAPYQFIEKYADWDSDYKKFPYYIMIVGSIKNVPLELQYLLDVRHSVGRLFFSNKNDYELYVKKIINFKPSQSKNILFFAPVHSETDPTYYSNKYLVKPLISALQNKFSDYNIELLEKDYATEENLFKATENKKISLLFTASHGLGLPKKYKDQQLFQGSIVCQDAEFNSNLLKSNKGLITGFDIEKRSLNCDIIFMFGCYTAGTLKNSDFKFWVPEEIKESLEECEASKEDFIGYLPQKLLASENGPVNVVAHIDPAWIFSFMNEYQTSQRIEPFKNALERIISNVSVGRSMRDFNLRYATLSVALLNYVIDHFEKNEKLNPLSISNIWVTRQDAQNYIILGDPAANI